MKMSGINERPMLPMFSSCENCGPAATAENDFLEIHNCFDDIIGYFNTQRAIDDGEYDYSLDVHKVYEKLSYDDFLRSIQKGHIKCHRCGEINNSESEKWPSWIRRVREAIKRKDFQYDESMSYNIVR